MRIIAIPIPPPQPPPNLTALLRVKPTAEMPHPGTNPTKAKRKRAKKTKRL
jgi:hypothetical protein